MWHNIDMKKVLLLLPAMLLLTGCQDITFMFSQNDTHPAGLDQGSGSNSQVPNESYSYYPGDSVVDDAPGRPLNTANLTFKDIKDSKTDIKDVEEIKSYFNDTNNILTSIENPLFFSTKSDGTAFLGVESTYSQGKMTLNFASPIYHVVVTARAYSYINYSFNEEKLIIDQDVAISANEKGYIKLSNAANEANNASKSSECSFAFSTPVNKITFKVGKQRAILEKIAVYF